MKGQGIHEINKSWWKDSGLKWTLCFRELRCRNSARTDHERELLEYMETLFIVSQEEIVIRMDFYEYPALIKSCIAI